MLAVIDYGAGNLRSVLHALRFLEVPDVRLVQQPDELEGADRIILPGVGAFGAGMDKLHEQCLIDPIKTALMDGIPYLGICLGMQFLFEYSDEMGHHEGFGVLPGHVTRFPAFEDLKVPHMGWNRLIPQRDSVLMQQIQSGSYAYFVHSYYCVPSEEDDVLLTTEYGFAFTSAVQRDSIYGVQFHPEKSQQTGLQILRNFLALEGVTA